MIVTVSDLVKLLADWSPDTHVEVAFASNGEPMDIIDTHYDEENCLTLLVE